MLLTKRIEALFLETLVMDGILEHIVLKYVRILKYLFWYICIKTRKEKNLTIDKDFRTISRVKTIKYS